MALFALLAGSHSEPIHNEGGGISFVTYDAPPEGSDNEVIIESPLDLVGLFGRARFRRVGKMRMGTPSARVTPPRRPTPEPVETEEPAGEESEGPPHNEASFGDDITEQFPEAEAQGLRVWKRDGKMYVCTEDQPTAPIHDKGLTKSTQVQKVVDEYTATHHTAEEKE